MLTDDERRAELPVETELVDGAWYQSEDRAGLILGCDLKPNGKRVWFRLAPVACYEPPKPKPETPEPQNVGAVVRDAHGGVYVRNINDEWNSTGVTLQWSRIKQPVEVLSEGVEL